MCLQEHGNDLPEDVSSGESVSDDDLSASSKMENVDEIEEPNAQEEKMKEEMKCPDPHEGAISQLEPDPAARGALAGYVRISQLRPDPPTVTDVGGGRLILPHTF
jgi:hypothetical protein